MREKIFLMLTLLMVIFCANVYAEDEQISATLSKEISIVYNNEIKEFYDVNGTKVYPILYQGTTYLPVRAVSSMFSIDVKWDGENNKIYLSTGKSDPVTCKTIDIFVSGKNETVLPNINKTISIEYKEKVQSFVDVNGKTVYPLSYQGTTYLPVRAISNMYGATIDWDGENQKITIERKNEIAEISNVTIKVIDGVLCATITTKSPLYDYKYYSLTEPNRLVIDLQNSKFGISTEQQAINYSVLQKVRFGSHENNLSKIVLDVDKIDEYSVAQSKDRLTTYFALTSNFVIPDDSTQEKDYTLVASIGNTIYIPEIKDNDSKNENDDNKSGDNDNENTKDDDKTLTPEQIAKLAKVTSVVYSPTNEVTKIKIDGNYEFEEVKLDDSKKFAIDIKGARLETDGPTEIEPKNNNIVKIRFAQNKDDVVRIVFDLNEKANANVKERSDYLQVYFDEIKVKNVVYEAFDKYATLTLKNVKKSVFSSTESTRYNRLTLSFSSSRFKTESESIESDDKFVKDIEVKASKIVINFAGETIYDMKQVGNDVVITISYDKNNEKKKFVILLDAGHGGTDPGACRGKTEAEKHLPENQEKTYTLAVMLKLKELLEDEDDIEIRTSRTTDVFIDRQGRLDFILDNEDADLLVSIHINSNKKEKYQGTMVLYHNKPNEKEDYGITSKELASFIKNNIVNDTGLKDLGIVDRVDLWILEQNDKGKVDERTGEKRPVTNLPAVICELCLISNDADYAKLVTEEFQDAAANAIYKGILEAKEQMGK